jgi:hypothetical protein
MGDGGCRLGSWATTTVLCRLLLCMYTQYILCKAPAEHGIFSGYALAAEEAGVSSAASSRKPLQSAHHQSPLQEIVLARAAYFPSPLMVLCWSDGPKSLAQIVRRVMESVCQDAAALAEHPPSLSLSCTVSAPVHFNQSHTTSNQATQPRPFA